MTIKHSDNDTTHLASLLDQKDALTVFIDTLFDASADAEAGQKSAMQTANVADKLWENKSAPPDKEPGVVELSSDSDPATLASSPVSSDINAAQETAVDNGSQAIKLICLEMAGLKLAIPEDQFGGIIDFSGMGQLSQMESRYLLGIFTHGGSQTKIINTPLLVIPEKYQQFYGNDATGKDHSGRLKKVLLLGDGVWGLACDAAGQVITVSVDDIHWRTAKAKRIWLAGTAIKQKCAILAVDGLLNSVEKQD